MILYAAFLYIVGMIIGVFLYEAFTGEASKRDLFGPILHVVLFALMCYFAWKFHL